MNILLRLALHVIQVLSLLILGILLCFWSIVVLYSVGNLASGGPAAVRQWYLHIALRPNEATRETFPGWAAVALRFVEVAAVTVVLWLANRKTIRKILVYLRR